jgi:hypothetical protein
MWEVWYGLEATNDLDDNGSLVTELLFAMEALAKSDGWLQQGVYHQQDDVVIWQILNHLMFYQRLIDQQVAKITLLKPNESGASCEF